MAVIDSLTATPQISIYMVPRALRNSSIDEFTPQTISIGPFHYGEEELLEMQVLKRTYLDAFRDRVSQNMLIEINQVIKMEEQRVRKSYQQTLKIKSLNSEQFTDIILLDSFFIIELLIRNHEFRNELKPIDELFQSGWRLDAVRRDILLLENQIPYFLLNRVYELVQLNFNTTSRQDYEGIPNLLELSINFFHFESLNRFTGKNFQHFNDLGRSIFVNSVHAKGVLTVPLFPSEQMPPQIHDMPSVVELDRAGLKFEIGGDWNTNLKIQKRSRICVFDSLVLNIPPIKISHLTKPLILNIMALEQCRYPSETYLCNYMFFMDSIIKNEKDVRLLIDKKIISHNLGQDSKVVQIFSCSSLPIIRSDSIFFDLAEELKQFNSNWFNKSKAKLKIVYHDHFWKGVSMFCAVLGMLWILYQLMVKITSSFMK